MGTIRTISRILVGLVLIFSGFVKGVDPLGTAFKIDDYLLVYGMDWLMPYSLALSILLSTFEFTLGVLLILNVKPVISSWLLLLLMSFFSLVTLYDAIYEPVSDCGCFGDAIKLTNWETFYKNVFLMVPTLILFIQRDKLKSPFRPVGEWALVLGVPLIFVWFSMINYNNLPMIDFLAWKVGNKMTVDRTEPIQFYLTYRNIETGEEKQYLSPDYPYNDPEWLAQWEFVTQCVVDPNPAPEHNLQILDQDYSDVTAHFLENPTFQFILVVWDAGKVKKEPLRNMNEFFYKAENDGHSFIAIAPTIEEGQILAEEFDLDYEFYFADDIELKIMVRSNPGLLLMKDGVLLEKWSHKNFPEYERFVKDFVNGESGIED
jgi:uncharacterized membrane protein YphA (DoxX/SURF4 family)